MSLSGPQFRFWDKVFYNSSRLSPKTGLQFYQSETVTPKRGVILVTARLFPQLEAGTLRRGAPEATTLPVGLDADTLPPGTTISSP